MKRLHIHVTVEDLPRSIDFYSALFGASPTTLKDDYAKWSLEDPSVNFAISTRCGTEPGLSHLGIEADTDAEFEKTAARIEKAGETITDRGAVSCCYAQSNKGWARDPSGIAWELFHSFGTAEALDSAPIKAKQSGTSCSARSGCC